MINPIERKKEDNRTYTATSLPKERAKTPERAKPLISSGQAALGLPLLNLDGPPPTIEHGSPSKRKRKRKKKKKFDQMHQTQATGGDDPMDVDADAKEVGNNLPSGHDASTEPSKCRII